MEELAVLLCDDPHEEGLPFSSSVNEAKVLNSVKRAVVEKSIDDAWKKRIRQWMQFNKMCNLYEEEPYQTWVAQVYSQIEALLNSIDSSMQSEKLLPEQP